MFELFTWVLVVVFGCAPLCNANDWDFVKIPALFHLDDYDRCMQFKEKSLYCSATIQLESATENSSSTWMDIEKIISDPANYRHDRLRYGICVPTSCPEALPNISFYQNPDNINALANLLSACYSRQFEDAGLKGNVTELKCNPDYAIDAYDIIFGLIFAIIFLFVLFASWYEGNARSKPPEIYDKITHTKLGTILTCFSLRKNWERLGKPLDGPHVRKLRVIQGIRFFNMGAVVITHTCMLAMSSPVINPQYVEGLTRNSDRMLLLNGSFAVETFFLLSGLLLSYHFFQTFEGRKQVKLSYILLAIVNRYLRMTPTLAVVAAFSGTWMVKFGSGPLWDKFVGTEYRNCRENWWATLFYLNNYYDVEHICLQQSWYVSADFQLFLVSLVIVMLMWRYQNRINLILGSSFALALAIVFFNNYFWDLDIITREYPENLYGLLLHVPEWTKAYCPAHTNLGGYVVGLYTGYMFYKNRDAPKLSGKKYSLMWWAITWGPTLGTIYLGSIFYGTDFTYSKVEAGVYVALARNVFVACVAASIFGISRGLGWIIRYCTEWTPVQYLGRLTFSVYAIHTSIIRMRGGIIRSPMFVSDYGLFTQTAADILLSYVGALGLCLFIEMPVSALQKLMVPQLARTRNVGPSSEKSPIQTIGVIVNNENHVSKI